MKAFLSSRRFFAILLCVFVVLAVVVGLSFGNEMSSAVGESAVDGFYPSFNGVAGADKYPGGYGGYDDGFYEAPSDSAQDAPSDRKLIRTVSVRMETQTYDDFMTDVNSSLLGRGGYVESSEESNRNGSHMSGSRTCTMTLRVPASELDGFLQDIDGMGQVLYRQSHVDDVTESYTDVLAYKTAKETERDTLLGLLEMADSLGDVLAIQDRLTEVQYAIDRQEAMLRMWDSQVDYSRVTLTVNEVVELTPIEEKGFWESVGDGIKDNFESVVGFFEDLAYVFMTHIPAICTIGIIGVACWFAVLKPLSRKHCAKSGNGSDGSDKDERHRDDA